MLDLYQHNYQILSAVPLKHTLDPVILHHLFSATVLDQDAIISSPGDCSGFLSGLGTSILTLDRLFSTWQPQHALETVNYVMSLP